jgi:hypothetical protein
MGGVEASINSLLNRTAGQSLHPIGGYGTVGAVPTPVAGPTTYIGTVNIDASKLDSFDLDSLIASIQRAARMGVA